MHATGLPSLLRIEWSAKDYDLAGTLASGQAFRWEQDEGGWQGVVGSRWVRLNARNDSILAEVVEPIADWRWLAGYLQVELDLSAVITSFPDEEPMRAALAACKGLRLLRQDPWECLASFICSSTKQIVQIQQIVELLCQRYGEALPVLPGAAPAWGFPTPAQLAAANEAGLRGCKMGFRAPYVLAAARAVAEGRLDLEQLRGLSCPSARDVLTELPGVGAKIANCVLLFAYGFQEAFPVDVWVMKALRQLYFPKRRPSPARLQRFIASYFGPNAGYAQQYLFHFMRTARRKSIESPAVIPSNVPRLI
jgi:N-glycosylase/DNA lyase